MIVLKIKMSLLQLNGSVVKLCFAKRCSFSGNKNLLDNGHFSEKNKTLSMVKMKKHNFTTQPIKLVKAFFVKILFLNNTVCIAIAKRT